MARKDRALFPYQEEGARWLAENPRAGLFDSIMKVNLAQDDAFSKAISNFAAALGGAGG